MVLKREELYGRPRGQKKERGVAIDEKGLWCGFLLDEVVLKQAFLTKVSSSIDQLSLKKKTSIVKFACIKK